MGRLAAGEGELNDTGLLFPSEELPAVARPQGPNFASLKRPVWTHQKALLIQEYLRLFTFVTKHGAYIDGFAAPQRRDMAEICSARLVLENKPAWIKDFWLCDIDQQGVTLLNELGSLPDVGRRRVNVLPGDFNKTVDDILSSTRIKATTATFALLDQRTFECEWTTLEKLARHKPGLNASTTKIELFYFFATGWLDRSIAAVRLPQTAEKLDRWWGRTDWQALRGMQPVPRADFLASRFTDELGYKYAYSYAIHSEKRRGRTMYHMIHATDHDEAAKLMLRAYRKVSGRGEGEFLGSQVDMDDLWREVQ